MDDKYSGKSTHALHFAKLYEEMKNKKLDRCKNNNPKYKVVTIGSGRLFFGKSNKYDSLTINFENESEFLELLKDLYPKTYIKIKDEIAKDIFRSIDHKISVNNIVIKENTLDNIDLKVLKDTFLNNKIEDKVIKSKFGSTYEQLKYGYLKSLVKNNSKDYCDGYLYGLYRASILTEKQLELLRKTYWRK